MSGYGYLFQGVHQVVQGTALGVAATFGIGETAALDAPDPAILQPSPRQREGLDSAVLHAIDLPIDRAPSLAAIKPPPIEPEHPAPAPREPPVTGDAGSAIGQFAFDVVVELEAPGAGTASSSEASFRLPFLSDSPAPPARSGAPFRLPFLSDGRVTAFDAPALSIAAADLPFFLVPEAGSAPAYFASGDLPAGTAPSFEALGPGRDAAATGVKFPAFDADVSAAPWLGDPDAKRRPLLMHAAGEPIAATPENADEAPGDAAAPETDSSGEGADGQASETDPLSLQTLSRGGLALSGGYSSIEGPVGSIKISRTNIGAPGRDITASARYSKIQSLFEFGISDSNVMGSGLALAPTFYYSRSSATGFGDGPQSSSFRQTARGINLYISRAFAGGFKVSTNYRFSDESFRIRGRDAVCDPSLLGSPFCNALGKSRNSVFSLALSLDRRDNAVDPTRGFQLRVTQDFAGPGGTTRYARIRFGGSFYHRLGGNLNVSLGLEGGYLTSIGGRSIPLFDRFYIGGNSMRGFDLRGMGPKVRPIAAPPGQTTAIGGRAYYVARLEVSMRLDGAFDKFGVSPSLFVDAGSVFGARKSELVPGEALIGNSAKPRVAVGFGLSFNVAPGKLRFNIAQPVARQAGDRSKIFSIAFGTAF